MGSEKLQKLGNLCSRERESMGENGSLLLMVFESRVNKYWLCNRERGKRNRINLRESVAIPLKREELF